MNRLAQSAEDMKRLLAALEPDELVLLTEYLGAGASQREIAKANGLPLSTVAYRIRQAIRKLNAAGIPVAAPVKSKAPKLVPCDPADMRRLTLTETPIGPPMGKWIDSKERGEE